MSKENQIRTSAVVTLLIALVLGFGSAWFNHQARMTDDAVLRCDASGIACHLFTLTFVFAAICGFEFYRAKRLRLMSEARS